MSGDINDLLKYRLSRAEESIDEAVLLAESNHWNACVNRLYYACFYAVSALLIQHNLSSPKHSGIRSLFNSNFVKTGIIQKQTTKIYNFLFERRQESDYDDFIIFNRSDVIPWIEDTQLFVKNLKDIIIKKN